MIKTKYFFVQDPITRFALTTQTPSTSTMTIATTTKITRISKSVPATSIDATANKSNTNTILRTKKSDCSNIQMKQNLSKYNKSVIVIAVIASVATLTNIILCMFLRRQVYVLDWCHCYINLKSNTNISHSQGAGRSSKQCDFEIFFLIVWNQLLKVKD